MAIGPDTRIGPYEITALIGAGGMGEVYRATDTTLKRTVAIKVLPEAVSSDGERLARFQREAELLAQLNHPNIAQIYGLERLRPSQAEDLRLRGEGSASGRAGGGAGDRPPRSEAGEREGEGRRDGEGARLRPGESALLPEGSSASVSMSPTISLTAAATQVGMIVGTAAYMAPEQARGRSRGRTCR